MDYIRRTIEPSLLHHLERGKSILLLGPRQTGKTTLIKHIPADFSLSFVQKDLRQRYERSPELLGKEIEEIASSKDKKILVVIDEVQKVPVILDIAQDLIDRNIAQFILTGSSARKLKRGNEINLLPGRVISFKLDSLSIAEFPNNTLKSSLFYGSLPGIVNTNLTEDKEAELRSYVETYLEEEVRAEALVRNLGHFSRFLELAGLESGKIINYSSLSQEIGINKSTVASYFEILYDCLIAERIEPISRSQTRKKLTKANRFLIFDLGVRRFCAREGTNPPTEHLGHLFEQFVGLELIRASRYYASSARLRFWRDPDGPEIDWVLENLGFYLPIEVKWTDKPTIRDAKNINIFLKEYKNAKSGYVVCRTERPYQICDNIKAVHWKDIQEIVKNINIYSS